MEKLLVTMDERKWIEENATIQMGTNVKYKVMDVDKVAKRIMEQRKDHSLTPFLEIQPVSEDAHKTPNRMPTFQKDPLTGVLYGICLGDNEHGNPKWQKPQLQDHLSLNLENFNDAKIWAVIRFHPQIKGSPFAVQTPYYKIYDPVEKAREERSEIDSMKKAWDRIDSILDDPKAMVNFTRFLGIDLPDNSNFEIVRGKLLAFAKNHPYDFNKRWESKVRSYGEYFESARAVGIVTSEPDRGYMFQSISLGMTKEEAIKFLSSDSTVMTSINNALTDKDEVIKSVARSINTKKEEKTEEIFD
jgi:hypothetical protein